MTATASGGVARWTRGVPGRRRPGAQQRHDVLARQMQPPRLPAQPLAARWSESSRRGRSHPRRVGVTGDDAGDRQLGAVARVLGDAGRRERVLVDHLPAHDHARTLEPGGESEAFAAAGERHPLHRAGEER